VTETPAAAVARAARTMLERGLVVATQGNASARDGDRMWITPSAVPYPAMADEDIVALALDGTPAAGGGPPSSEWRLHAAIYRARPDVGAVVHTHSDHATAWSHLGEELPVAPEELGEPVRTAAFAPPGTDALAAAAVEALGDASAVLLARHGVVGVGPAAERALDVCALVEHHARVAWLLRARR